MNRQTPETIDYLVREDIEEDFFQFADLSLAEKQVDEINGGPGSRRCSQCAISNSNHNETIVEEEVEHLLSEDLAVPDADAIKGGEKLPPPTMPIGSPAPPRK